jgi:hypothetical protein
MGPSADPGALGPHLTVEQRLRRNAEAICRQTGSGWREEVAGLMGCGVDDVGVGPVSRHRDSEPLDESNFRVILRHLQSIDPRVAAERFGHWGVGWIEEIVIPLDNSAVIHGVEAWVPALQDYPVANEEDYAQLEADQAADSAFLDDNDDGLDAAGGDSASDPPRTTSATHMLRRLDNLTTRAPVDPPSL